jgi:serine phosphatase RsbU (regulator of sigma subunit)
MGSQQRRTVMHAQIDMISMLHVSLLADRVDFSRLAAPDTRALVRRRLQAFFANAWLRQDYNTMGNSRVQLVRVMVLDPGGRLLVSAAETSSRLVAGSRFRTIAEQDSFYAMAAARMLKRGGSTIGDGLVSVNYNDFTGPELRTRWGEALLRRENARIYHFPHNLFLYPIRMDGIPVGYYLFEINAQSYSGLLGGMLRLNLLYLIVILVLYFFLMKYAGEIILRPINMVVEGINHIRSGDYTYQIWIATNDELDNLGKVYNYTRKKLHYTRKELEHYTQHLEAVVEDRARELNRAWKILKEDLFLAKRIQKNLLAGDLSETRGVDISVAYQPLGDVGGDFYNIHEAGPDHIRIFLADATGHGVQAALVTMLIKSEYEKMKDEQDPVAILKRMNHQFINTYRSLTVFFTGVIVDIDLKQRELRYIAAGHPAQYLLSGNTIVRLFERGKMIGVVSEPEFPVQRVPIKDDDKLVLFTDGLFEQFNPEGDEMGENHLHGFLGRLAEEGIARQDVGQISSLLLKAGDDFRAGSEMNDDITLLCVGFRRHIPLLKPGKSRIRREE